MEDSSQENGPEESESGTLYREFIHRFCEETTAHGFGKAASAKFLPVRVFWALIILVAATISLHQIGICVKKYMSFHAMTLVKLSHQRFVRFPGVSVCNINAYRLSNVSYLEAELRLREKQANSSNDRDTEADKKREQLERVLYHVTQYSDEKLKQFGHQRKDMIVKCQAPGRWGQLPCGPSNFTWFHDRIHGNCYTFNAARANASLVFIEDTGYRQGFHVTLYVESDEYWAYLTESLGFLVSIHNPEDIPFPEDTGYFMAPGTATSIALQSRYLERLTGYDGETCESANAATGGVYSEVACRKACVAEGMKKKCKCVSLLYRNKPYCNPFNETEDSCVEEVLKQHRKPEPSSRCSCAPACKEETFSSTISSSVWPSSAYIPSLIQTLSEKKHRAKHVVKNLTTARENMAYLMVYFSTMTQESIIQKPQYQIESLLGDIGGQLGLFIGISVLTLVEFLALMWELTNLAFDLHKNKSTIKDQRSK